MIFAVSGTSFGEQRQNCYPGDSIGMTVEIFPFDAIIARVAPPAPWKRPISPIWFVSKFVEKDAAGIAIRLHHEICRIQNRRSVAGEPPPRRHGHEAERRQMAPEVRDAARDPPVPLPHVIPLLISADSVSLSLINLHFWVLSYGQYPFLRACLPNWPG